ncbi:PRD domain-containing protein [Peribacillus psychrosaccharolyticus]|uniref:PRD domain-containing protein n=1 Tax=Peribacillus psychrosaccharolyticus TaxID=1407 RepID=A0A974NIH2_PERPY|nr:PRD domain-containing protein [Peribacillus psychrosaccharolyticus]MEC2057604.1 PRD domain-containing protein [Peribacillus psychrosaccharolyticus]MED3744749.1 PRD domain-containing protein [Peribacillus psychrosaccharolyticus]QQS98550.1 PRD domain-containing protein [Peribacillus psychrosaccharolyticus]
MEGIHISKVLNNNVAIAVHPSYGETVVIGKGVGFNRKKGDVLPEDLADKMFVLKSEKEQANYKKLLPNIDEEMQASIIETIQHINSRVPGSLNEHIHVGLTDHLLFALNRVQNGMEMKNPFLRETITLYPFEYEVAKEVIEIMKEKTGIGLPEGEIGFITLHIHSAVVNKELAEVNKFSQLVSHLVGLIEDQLDFKMDKESVDYMRLVRHLRFTIDRVLADEKIDEPQKIAKLLKEEYPVCYNLAWKLIKIMQKNLLKPVYDAEAVYLTMHLQRLQTKIK